MFLSSPSLFILYPLQTYQPLLRAFQDKSTGSNDDLTIMPAYFNFLTVMAIHAFIEEEVDVAVLEVGIGGEFDCTNVVPSPVVCGVSSLGYDHTDILGKCIDCLFDQLVITVLLICNYQAGVLRLQAPQ